MKIKTIIRIISLILILACATQIIIVFAIAYSTPQKAVMVTINDYNEANIELPFIILTIPAIAFLFYDYMSYTCYEDFEKDFYEKHSYLYKT